MEKFMQLSNIGSMTLVEIENALEENEQLKHYLESAYEEIESLKKEIAAMETRAHIAENNLDDAMQQLNHRRTYNFTDVDYD